MVKITREQIRSWFGIPPARVAIYALTEHDPMPEYDAVVIVFFWQLLHLVGEEATQLFHKRYAEEILRCAMQTVGDAKQAKLYAMAILDRRFAVVPPEAVFLDLQSGAKVDQLPDIPIETTSISIAGIYRRLRVFHEQSQRDAALSTPQGRAG